MCRLQRCRRHINNLLCHFAPPKNENVAPLSSKNGHYFGHYFGHCFGRSFGGSMSFSFCNCGSRWVHYFLQSENNFFALQRLNLKLCQKVFRFPFPFSVFVLRFSFCVFRFENRNFKKTKNRFCKNSKKP